MCSCTWGPLAIWEHWLSPSTRGSWGLSLGQKAGQQGPSPAVPSPWPLFYWSEANPGSPSLSDQIMQGHFGFPSIPGTRQVLLLFRALTQISFSYLPLASPWCFLVNSCSFTKEHLQGSSLRSASSSFSYFQLWLYHLCPLLTLLALACSSTTDGFPFPSRCSSCNTASPSHLLWHLTHIKCWINNKPVMVLLSEETHRREGQYLFSVSVSEYKGAQRQKKNQ